MYKSILFLLYLSRQSLIFISGKSFNPTNQGSMFGVIGSGSWATALTKILTDKQHPVNWWIRNAANIDLVKKRKHNPHYINSVMFDTSLLNMSTDISEVVKKSDTLIIAVPSAYAVQALEKLSADDFKDKKIVSAIKGLLP